MKPTLLTCLAFVAFAASAFAQTPPPLPDVPTPPPAPVAATPVATVVVTPAASATPREADDLQSRIERKTRKHGVNITFGGHDKHDGEDADAVDHSSRSHNSDSDDAAFMAIPIVGIIFTTLFGAPVLIVGLIMFFSYWKARSLHRTVRLMVEKGQPVPEALFATPHSPAKQRSDMRRGVVLLMVGLGLIFFLAAVNSWGDGSWALGLIPLLIGAGYLVIWRLEGGPKRSTDNPPPLP
ncbi:MAG: DUF6249 domain-containing protein [Verrucomicrobiota bacterium]|nr:DUF6249 domain-containing protein [Verrucomicrobiota bacterium]